MTKPPGHVSKEPAPPAAGFWSLRNNRGWALAALAGRLLVGGALSLSGFLKLMSPPEEFAMAIENFKIISSYDLIMPLAHAIPWAELLVGVFLLAGFLLPLAAAGAMLLHGTFCAALLSTLARGINLGDCGCFGRNGPHLTAAQMAGLDIFLFLFAAVVFFDRQRLLSLDRWIKKK